jgi:hypothetical protein
LLLGTFAYTPDSIAKPAGGHFGFGDGLLRAVFFGFGFGLGFGFTVALAVAAGVALTVGLAVGFAVALTVGLAVAFIVLLAVGVGFFVSASALLDDAIRAIATKRDSFLTDAPT